MMSKGLGTFLAFGFFGWLIVGLVYGNKKSNSITHKSNCDRLLKKFNDKITIHPDKIANLKRAHNTLRDKIRNYFQYKTDLPVPDFYIQGSYKMDTIVENRNFKCDVDLAIIFPKKPRVGLEGLQRHVKNALHNHTTRGITVKPTCVRLNYVKDFHIDLPIYFIDNKGKMYYGSRGGSYWEPSNPKLFVKWFNSKVLRRPQLVRVIRYLKAWADHTRKKTQKKFPSGLVMTLWAIEYYKPSSRDDIALFNTCKSILKYLDNNFKYQWSAKMPIEPFDNVLNRLTSSQKSSFYNELTDMVSLMSDAVYAKRNSLAISKWKRIFGPRF